MAGSTLRSRSQGAMFFTALALIGVGGWIVLDPGRPPRKKMSSEFTRFANPVVSFDLSTISVPRDEIHAGGPRKDSIPALTNPRGLPAAGATYLEPDDRVIGVSFNGEPAAYPLKLLTYHEIVNDAVGGVPVAVTYCPLCDSVAAFDRRVGATVREFGVSGLLYNSNVLLFDRDAEIESLWSQLMGQGISGPGVGVELRPLPVELTTWEDWRSRWPETRALSPNTGHRRNYGNNPYREYFKIPILWFPVQPTSDRIPMKTRVLGVWSDRAARAYRIDDFGVGQTVEDELDGRKIALEYRPKARSLRVARADEGLHWVYGFWFAWHAFHPQTDVYEPQTIATSGP